MSLVSCMYGRPNISAYWPAQAVAPQMGLPKLRCGYHGSAVAWKVVAKGRVVEPRGPNSRGCGSSKRSNETRVLRRVDPRVTTSSTTPRKFLRSEGQLFVRKEG